MPDEKITFHYAEKTATIKKDDATALGYNENQDYMTNILINEGFLNFDNYVYIDLGNDKFYVIDENSNLYYVWNNFYSNPIIGGVVSDQHQTVRIFKNVFDYSKIIELFR